MKNFEEFGFLENGDYFIFYPGDFKQQVYRKRDESYFENIKNKNIFTGDFDMLCLVVKCRGGKIE